MPKFLSIEEAFASCEREGLLMPQVKIDVKKIEANLLIADEDLETAKDPVKNKRWNSAYKLHYDVLHILVETYLRFDKVKSLNHQCLFAYLCKEHPNLEFSWEFFEMIRTKRNGINYYGQPVSSEDWKDVELQLKPYITSLKREIKKKLNSL